MKIIEANRSDELGIVGGKSTKYTFSRLELLKPILNQIGLSIKIHYHEYWRRGTDVHTEYYGTSMTQLPKCDYIQIFVVNEFFDDSSTDEPTGYDEFC